MGSGSSLQAAFSIAEKRTKSQLHWKNTEDKVWVERHGRFTIRYTTRY